MCTRDLRNEIISNSPFSISSARAHLYETIHSSPVSNRSSKMNCLASRSLIFKCFSGCHGHQFICWSCIVTNAMFVDWTLVTTTLCLIIESIIITMRVDRDKKKRGTKPFHFIYQIVFSAYFLSKTWSAWAVVSHSISYFLPCYT